MRWSDRIRLRHGLIAASLTLAVGGAAVGETFAACRNVAPSPAAEEAEPVVVEHPGLAPAIEAASRDAAPVLLVLSVPACPACVRLREETLAADGLAAKTGPLHLVWVDVSAKAKRARQFAVQAVPDLVLMTGEGKILARRQGCLSPEDLADWITQGRRRAEAGLWLGTAPSEKVDERLNEARRDRRKLIQMLGARDPADRARVAAVLAGMGERAVPVLIEALEEAYLGVRVGAAEVLGNLAPGMPSFDPWADAEARADRVRVIRRWWSENPALEAADAPPDLDAMGRRSATSALEAVRSEDPMARTEGMTALVQMGRAALPAVRRAIAECAEAGRSRIVRLLEDVRWAILLPGPVDRRDRTRRDLARGTSEERAEATLRLASVGRDALPALEELVADPDPLVQESAVATLKALGGTRALEAMATLLDSPDPNLRTVAAQALGKSKNTRAAQWLAEVVDDPEEMVACVAIAALEEVGGKQRADALIGRLKDRRWRVRAAAAEALGKLEVKAAAEPLTDLLGDPDAFVVKAAVGALKRIKATPSRDRLLQLVHRLPDLSGLAAGLVVRANTPAALKTVEMIYDKADRAQRHGVMNALTEIYVSSDAKDDHWRPLLEKAMASEDPLTRRQVGEVLKRRSRRLRLPFVENLLGDDHPDVRAVGAHLVLQEAAHCWGVDYARDKTEFGILRTAEAGGGANGAEDAGASSDELDEVVATMRDVVERAGRNASARDVAAAREAIERAARSMHEETATPSAEDEDGEEPTPAERVAAIRRRFARWHALLAKARRRSAGPAVLLACYVTGDPVDDLPALAEVLGRENALELFKEVGGNWVAVVLARLPWPEARPHLERWSRKPVLFGRMLDEVERASEPIRDFLLDPARIVRAVESAEGRDLYHVADPLLESPSEPASLLRTGARSDRIVSHLAQSKAPAAQALALHVLAREKGRAPLERFTRALDDANPWVRQSAVGGVLTHVTALEERERILAPLLGAEEMEVRCMTATALLRPTLRSAAGASSLFQDFRFGEVTVHPSRGISMRSDRLRPAAQVDRTPDFLPTVYNLMQRARREKRREAVNLYALLMAQYGDTRGLDLVLRRWTRTAENGVPEALLIGLVLTKDQRFLPALRARLAGAGSADQARNLLQYLRGVRGEEARALRREINRRMRTAPR